VTGNHPNGAIAFLPEDGSDEVSALTPGFLSPDHWCGRDRQFISAVAVFSSSGSLVLANNAYIKPLGAIRRRDKQPCLSEELQVWRIRFSAFTGVIKLQERSARGAIVYAVDRSVWRAVKSVPATTAPCPAGQPPDHIYPVGRWAMLQRSETAVFWTRV
jgi:hypothetical protein